MALLSQRYVLWCWMWSKRPKLDLWISESLTKYQYTSSPALLPPTLMLFWNLRGGQIVQLHECTHVRKRSWTYLHDVISNYRVRTIFRSEVLQYILFVGKFKINDFLNFRFPPLSFGWKVNFGLFVEVFGDYIFFRLRNKTRKGGGIEILKSRSYQSYPQIKYIEVLRF